jgi:mannose-1-phosphate guanylyltransferase
VPDSLQTAPSLDASDRVAEDAEVGAGVILGRDCSLGSKVAVIGPSVLGDGCDLGDGARVEGSVLWSGVRLADGAAVRNSVLGAGCSIGAGANIDGCILADGVTVQAGARLQPGTRLNPNEVAS